MAKIGTHEKKIVELSKYRPFVSGENEPAEANTARLIELMHITQSFQDVLHVERAAERVGDRVPAGADGPDEHLALEPCVLGKARKDGSYLWSAKNVAQKHHDLRVRRNVSEKQSAQVKSGVIPSPGRVCPPECRLS